VISDVYDYQDAAGGYLYSVVIERTETGKSVKQGVREGESFAWGVNGRPRVLYRLPELVAHLQGGSAKPIYVVEGEKDAESLRALGLVATTNPMGAGKWTEEHTEALQGARCVRVVADRDEPGRAHARAVYAALAPVVDSIELLEPPPDLGEHADVTDLLGAGRSLSELVPLDPPEAAVPFALKVHTAREIAALPDPPAGDLLLGPLLVRGQRTIVGAHTGEGKTTMGLALVAAVALERDFLGWKGSDGRALVLDLEQGLRTVKRRLREADLDRSDTIDYVRVPDGLALDKNVRHRAVLEETLAAGLYDLVYLDPLYKAHAGDSNDERAAVDLMRHLDSLRETFGFALLVATHCRKPQLGSKFSIHDLFGSSGYVRGAEVVLGLQRVRDGFSRLHFLRDRDGDLPIGQRWGLLFSAEEGFRRDPKDGQPSTQERLRELREADREITQTQAAEALGVSDRTVRKYWHADEPDFEHLQLVEGGVEDA
jgi:AAA domain/Helix-turn-helix